MHLVPPNDNVPRRCAVIPGRTQDPEGFVATGCVLTGWDPEIEISVTGAKELGKFVGMVPGEDVEEIELRLAEKLAELEGIKLRLEQLEQIRELEAAVAA